MNRRLVVLSVLVLLTSCTMLSHQDNRQWESISCNGFESWDACMTKAAKVCPKGFDIRHQQENQVTQKRSMDFACK